MKILGVDFDRIDYKNFKLGEFLNGCSSATIAGITNNSETTQLIKERETICQACPLGQQNDTTCYRDISLNDARDKRKEIEKEFVSSNLNFQQKEQAIVHKLQTWIKAETVNRLHTLHAVSKQPILGCGCIRKCKQAAKTNSCPAGKW